jgi:hypothetical protein
VTVRGGLDDALEKLARRDELRRRAAGENPSTPPEVTELVEAIAGVITRYPNLGVTVGVEGAGDPVLLHFGFADGTVQVRADRPVASRPTAEAAPVQADFEIDLDDAEPPPRGSHDDQDRFGPTDYVYAEPPTAERPFVTPQSPAAPPPPPPPPPAAPPPPPPPAAYAPPPVPPQRSPFQPFVPSAATPEPTPAFPTEPASAFSAEPAPAFSAPEPLAKPIQFQAGSPEETEIAARRLAAMLRDNPTLLDDTQG